MYPTLALAAAPHAACALPVYACTPAASLCRSQGSPGSASIDVPDALANVFVAACDLPVLSCALAALLRRSQGRPESAIKVDESAMTATVAAGVTQRTLLRFLDSYRCAARCIIAECCCSQFEERVCCWGASTSSCMLVCEVLGPHRNCSAASANIVALVPFAGLTKHQTATHWPPSGGLLQLLCDAVAACLRTLAVQHCCMRSKCSQCRSAEVLGMHVQQCAAAYAMLSC
jgi:hypothetical protein